MIVFTEHEKKKYISYLLTVITSVLIMLIWHISFIVAAGYAFCLEIILNVLGDVTGRFIARILFTEVTPKSIRELKHSDKQYQYVLKLPKRDLYSYVYTRPLDTVNVRCWTYMGSYMIGVTSKKGVAKGEKAVT